MATIRFFLASKSKETSSLDVVVRFGGNRFKKATGISIPTNAWDSSGQKALSKFYKTAASANFKLDQVRRVIERVLYRVEKENIKLTDSKQFWTFYDCEFNGMEYNVNAKTNMLIADYIDEIFLARHNNFTLSRIDEFTNFAKLLRDFELHSGLKLIFSNIDLLFYDKFKQWGISVKKFSPNYVSQHIKKLKQVMNEAQQVDKIHSNNIHQSSQFKTINEEVDTIYLSTFDLSKLEDLSIDDAFVAKLYPRSPTITKSGIKQSYQIVKNRFLIGCYTGLRVSDFNRLRANNIYPDNTIRIITQKTTTPTIIPINGVIRRIIDSGFDFDNSLSNQKTCLYIKHICMLAGIDQEVEVRLIVDGVREVRRIKKYELVGTHTARRSFATNAYLAGIDPISICKITGHTTERMLLRYIKVSTEVNATLLASHPFFK